MPPTRPRFGADAALLCIALGPTATAGPPLTTDDPGILDPGRMEVILATTLEKTRTGDTWELPVLDVSLGLTRHVQVSAVVPRLVTDPDDAARKSDFGAGQVGIKWRFLERDRLALAVAPLYEFDIRPGAVRRGVTEDVDILAVPVVIEYQGVDWRFNAEVGYALAHNDRDELIYGLSVTRPLGPRMAWMIGIHASPDRHWDDHGLALRSGLDITLREDIHLLVGLGTGLDNRPDDEQLDLDAYFGIQWFR